MFSLWCLPLLFLFHALVRVAFFLSRQCTAAYVRSTNSSIFYTKQYGILFLFLLLCALRFLILFLVGLCSCSCVCLMFSFLLLLFLLVQLRVRQRPHPQAVPAAQAGGHGRRQEPPLRDDRVPQAAVLRLPGAQASLLLGAQAGRDAQPQGLCGLLLLAVPRLDNALYLGVFRLWCALGVACFFFCLYCCRFLWFRVGNLLCIRCCQFCRWCAFLGCRRCCGDDGWCVALASSPPCIRFIEREDLGQKSKVFDLMMHLWTAVSPRRYLHNSKVVLSCYTRTSKCGVFCKLCCY